MQQQVKHLHKVLSSSLKKWNRIINGRDDENHFNSPYVIF